MNFTIRLRSFSGCFAVRTAGAVYDRAPVSEVLPMEFEFKNLSWPAIPAALERAERYRLLNEPAQAESICQDILALDPENRDALVLLILALSDQFNENIIDNQDQAWSLLPRLNDEYLQAYYQGILLERQARGIMGGPPPGLSV